ncbi:MAG TPA: HisA/HisF-related TIM barrel protein, partial [Puia sp.]|nr:HisA/HisF-related TIM barrel protein [Puia sp.]
GKWYVYLNGGRVRTDMPCLDWARAGVQSGAGEILLTSMNHDGTKAGFARDITSELAELLPVPVIASGGGGTPRHFADILGVGKADAALAASIFHFKEVTIPELKGYLHSQGIAVRI